MAAPSAPPKIRLNAYGYLLARAWRHAEGHRPEMAAFFVLHALGGSMALTQPYFLGRLITSLQGGGPGMLGQAALWLGLMFAASVGFWMLHGPGRLIERRTAFHVYDHALQSLYGKVTELPFSWQQDNHSGSTISRINTATEALRDFVQEQFMFIHMVVRVVVAGGMLVWISPLVGVATLLTLVFIFACITAIDRRLYGIYNEYNERSHALSALFFDYVSNMATLLTLRLAELSRTSLGRAIQRLYRPFVAEVGWNEAKWCALEVLLSLVSAVTLVVYVARGLEAAAAAGAALALGGVVAIYQYQRALGNVLSAVAIHLGNLMRWQANWAAAEELTEEHARIGRAHRAVEAGDGAHPPVLLRGLALTRTREGGASFTVDAPLLALAGGEKIALIGESGGGKSTLLALLRGVYTADAGALEIAGAPRPLVDLHDMTSLVPQDPEIFESTIRFNITLGLEASEEEILRMARLAAFDGVLATLPRGLETDIREKGVNLSVGQKQRLALARGLFAAARSGVVLMDEPTSSLDLATEQAILLGLFEAFRTKTMIVSLHRLHLLPHFDRVLYMKDGRLIADGPVAELLARPGPVREVFQRYVVAGAQDEPGAAHASRAEPPRVERPPAPAASELSADAPAA